VPWYPAVLGVVTPVLLVGFGASALANRLAFAGWGIAVAVAAALVLRRAFETTWGRPGARWRIAARLSALLAPALALFAWLVERDPESLDVGLRAVLPRLYTPFATRPSTYFALAAVLAGAGAASALASLASVWHRERS
jgi:hypothetical protein